jgi:hypothetical protein
MAKARRRKSVMGPPRRAPGGDISTEQVKIRLTPDELAAWTKAAEAADAPSVVSWVRDLGNRAARGVR